MLLVLSAWGACWTLSREAADVLLAGKPCGEDGARHVVQQKVQRRNML